MKNLFFVIGTSLLLLSCSSSSEVPEQNSDSSSSINSIETTSPKNNKYDNNEAIIIERVFATNTDFTRESNNVLNCFDNDENSYWSTPLGSGPEEGIMIYLKDAVFLDRIAIKDKDGNNINDIVVYGNGESNQGSRMLEKSVSSIFIKAPKTYNSKYNNQRWEYPSDASFNISEIIFFKKGTEKYEVLTPAMVKGTVTASSELQPALAYGASNLVDGSKESAWAENVDGNGIGETIIFNLSENISFDKIKIWNGYHRSSEHRTANASLNQFELIIDGKSIGEFKAKNSSKANEIKLDHSYSGKTIQIKVASAHEGKKYKDLVISEILFYETNKPYLITTTSEEERVNETKGINNAILNTVIDRNINITQSESENIEGINRYTYETRSIILRSNNTFVLYETSSESINDYASMKASEKEKEVIADGNWEYKSGNHKEVELRIFGKKIQPESFEEMYVGTSYKESLNIFQDYITITNTELKGRKVVSSFPLQ